DVAERSARIRGTEVRNGFTFFGDFACLDRELDAAGLTVALGDARINLFALGETCRPLVVPVPAEVGATDDGRHFAVSDTDFNAAVVDFDDFGGHDSVLAQGAAIARTGIGQALSSKLL